MNHVSQSCSPAASPHRHHRLLGHSVLVSLSAVSLSWLPACQLLQQQKELNSFITLSPTGHPTNMFPECLTVPATVPATRSRNTMGTSLVEFSPAGGRRSSKTSMQRRQTQTALSVTKSPWVGLGARGTAVGWEWGLPRRERQEPPRCRELSSRPQESAG